MTAGRFRKHFVRRRLTPRRGTRTCVSLPEAGSSLAGSPEAGGAGSSTGPTWHRPPHAAPSLSSQDLPRYIRAPFEK